MEDQMSMLKGHNIVNQTETTTMMNLKGLITKKYLYRAKIMKILLIE